MPELKFESLHNHTLISDGYLSHLDLLAAAERQGVGIVGLTDHDCLPNAEIMDQLRAYAGPVQWTVGIELSTGLPKEHPEWMRHSVHILGLFIDPANEPILEFCEQIHQGRVKRMSRVVAHLQSLGMDITEAECQAAAGTSVPGQPHIVKAMLAKPQNVQLLATFKAEMAEATQTNPKLKKSYNYMLEGGARQEPYALVMGSKSFKPLPKADFEFISDLDSGVKLIRDAGGIAIFAHPYHYWEDFSPAMLEQLVKDGRIDGLELINENNISPHMKADLDILQGIVDRTGVAYMVNSDAHDEKDLEAFVTSPIGEASVGQTQRLLERFNPNLSWSRLK